MEKLSKRYLKGNEVDQPDHGDVVGLRDVDVGQGGLPDMINKYKSEKCFFLILFSRPSEATSAL